MPPSCLSRLDPFRICSAHGRRQSRVLPVSLPLASHPGIPGNIKDRRQHSCDAAGKFLSAHRLRHLFLQFRIPGGSPAYPGRETGGILDEGSAQPLHMEDSRNVMFALIHHHLLYLSLPLHGLLQALDGTHFQSTYLPDPVFRHLLQQVPVIPVGEQAVDLSHLLFQTHLSQKILRPFFC